MKNTDTQNDWFSGSMAQAALRLQSGDFESAYELITGAMCAAPDAPEPHNLLGIWFELSGDGAKARRHYRAAYALDPTFKPACKNLEQICTVFDSEDPRTYDYGVVAEDMATGKDEKHQVKHIFIMLLSRKGRTL